MEKENIAKKDKFINPREYDEKKLPTIIDALYKHFENKSIKTLNLEFVSYVLHKALEKTNKSLSEKNLHDLKFYNQNKFQRPESFEVAMKIFGTYFHETLENIVYEIIEILKKES